MGTDPVATASGSVFFDPRCQDFLRGFGCHVFSGSEMQPQTNTEPGAVATGSRNNKLVCNGTRTRSLLLPVPYSSTHDAGICFGGFGSHFLSGSEMQRRTNTALGAKPTGRPNNQIICNVTRTWSLLLTVPYSSTHDARISYDQAAAFFSKR